MGVGREKVGEAILQSDWWEATRHLHHLDDVAGASPARKPLVDETKFDLRGDCGEYQRAFGEPCGGTTDRGVARWGRHARMPSVAATGPTPFPALGCCGR
jgi:hypothetical protein